MTFGSCSTSSRLKYLIIPYQVTVAFGSCTTSPRLKVHTIPYQVTVTFGSCTTSPRLKVHIIPYQVTVAFWPCTTSWRLKVHTIPYQVTMIFSSCTTLPRLKVHPIPYQVTVTLGWCTTSPRLKVHTIPYQVTVAFGSCTTSPRLKVHIIPYQVTVTLLGRVFSVSSDSDILNVHIVTLILIHLSLWVMNHVIRTKRSNHSSKFLLDKSRVAENVQTECLCYFLINLYFPMGKPFNHIRIPYNVTVSSRLKVRTIPYQVTVAFGSCTTSPRLKVHHIKSQWPLGHVPCHHD